MEQPKEILQFWFGDWKPGQGVPEDRLKFWFGADSSTDQQIRDKFKALVDQAREGRLKHWEESPRDCLALILLLDQFSRHIYRNSPEAFASDNLALKLCLKGIDRGWDRELDPVERVFFYLPMEHSEDIQVQKKSLEHFIRLAQEAPESQWEFIDEALNYAIKHHEVIERFGRFPHRNPILGRESTNDEQAFLSEPDSGF